MRQPGAWLAILDAQHARFVTHDAHGFRTVRTRLSNTAGRLAATPVRDENGHSLERADDARPATLFRGDPHTRRREHFAALVAAELNNAAAQGLFARLVLAGPLCALRAVEEALDVAVRRRIAGRIIKNLVKVPDQDLAAHLPAWPLML